MIVGIPKEIKNAEYRIALIPAGAKSLVAAGHQVLVEAAAGEGSGLPDAEYLAVGAEIVPTAEEVYGRADLIVKVKEPMPAEYGLLRQGQVLLAYLHLAAAQDLTQALLDSKVVGIAYETVQLEGGSLPLLMPMSEVAGKLSIQFGAHWLQKENGGSGVLLGGVPGTSPGRVAIIGGGTVGTNAAKIALGMGADVTILDVNLDRLRYLSDVLSGRLTVLMSDGHNLERSVAEADLVIGALLIPGAKAKKVVTRAMIDRMRPGSVVVDVAVDQGGCVEGTVPKTFDDPVLHLGGVTLFCVTNMPGSVARTSTFALTNATFPYVLRLANLGYEAALAADPALARGLNVLDGKVVSPPVAEALGLTCTPSAAPLK